MTRSAATLLALLCLLALALRVPLLSYGVAPDELANLYAGPAWAIPFDAESAVNPPLLRTLVNAIVPDPWVVPAGRWVSLLCGTLAVPLAFALGRTLTGSATAALALALAFAVHPQMVWMGARFRAYAPWAAVGTWHLWALARWLDGEHRALRPVWASALLLPWLHYLSVPLLMALAAHVASVRSPRDALRAYGPSALGVLPLVPMVLSTTSTRVQTPVSIWRSLVPIGALGLRAPEAIERMLAPGNGPAPPRFEPAFAAVSAVLLMHVGRWPRLTAPQRATLVGAVALVLSTLAVGTVQYVRTPVSILLAVFAMPLCVLAVASSQGATRWLVLAAIALGTAGVPRDLAQRMSHDPEHGLRTAIAALPSWSTQRGDRPVFLAPRWAWVGAYHELTGRHVAEVTNAQCPTRAPCFVHEGVVWIATPEFGTPEVPDGLLIVPERRAPPWASTCAVIHEEPGLVVLDCHG